MNEDSPSRFSDSGDEERIGQYIRFNSVAYIGLLLGAASVAALSSPFLWPVPLIALIFCIPGLMLSRREDMGGRVPAWIGITLAIFLMSVAISKYCFERCVLYAEAQSISEKWLELVVAGEDEIAHQAMLPIAERQSSGISVDEYYEMDEDAAEERDKRFSLAPASKLLGYGDDVEIKLVKNVTQQFDQAAGLEFIQQIYRVSAPGKEPVEAKLSITSRYNKSVDRPTWIVGDCEPNDEPKPNLLENVSSLITQMVHDSKS